jgi:hypothetical protein
VLSLLFLLLVLIILVLLRFAVLAEPKSMGSVA